MFPVNVTVRQLAELVQGTVEGDGELVIHAARPLHEAQSGHITFLDNARHLAKLQASRASAAIVHADTPRGDLTVIRSADPMTAFILIAQRLHGRPLPAPSGIDARAAVDPSVCIGVDPSIAAFASIGAGSTVGARCRIHSGVAIGRDCVLGDDVVLYPNVVLYDGTILGDRTIIHANAVIGADGFGYRFQEGRHAKVPQLGNVEVGADVEIGACTAIDRGTFGSTQIGSGTKIDNLVQVAHNCRIGQHVILAGQVAIAGSCTIDDYSVLAGQVGIADHVHIGAGSVLGAKSGVMRDLPPGSRMSGAPARPDRENMRIFAALEDLPQMLKDMRRVKKQLGMNDEPKKRAG